MLPATYFCLLQLPEDSMLRRKPIMQTHDILLGH